MKTGQFSYDQEVEPFIKKAAGVRGFNSAVTRHMAKITGRDVKRQQVAMWIHPDSNQRVEPAFTTALSVFAALRLAVEELKL